MCSECYKMSKNHVCMYIFFNFETSITQELVELQLLQFCTQVILLCNDIHRYLLRSLISKLDHPSFFYENLDIFQENVLLLAALIPLIKKNTSTAG